MSHNHTNVRRRAAPPDGRPTRRQRVAAESDAFFLANPAGVQVDFTMTAGPAMPQPIADHMHAAVNEAIDAAVRRTLAEVATMYGADATAATDGPGVTEGEAAAAADGMGVATALQRTTSAYAWALPTAAAAAAA